MRDILHYNNQLILFITLTLLIIVIVVLGYKIWERHVGTYIDISMGFKEIENFNQITLEKQVSLYDDYRNYIDGRNELSSFCLGKDKRMIPYIVSPRCFTNKYSQCMEEKTIDTDDNTNNTEIPDSKNDIFQIFDEEDLNKQIGESIPEEMTLHTDKYKDGFNIASKTCQDQSYDMCLTDNFNFY